MYSEGKLESTRQDLRTRVKKKKPSDSTTSKNLRKNQRKRSLRKEI